MDEKLLYLVKTLSRTTKKDYENYVINSIYSKVNNYDLKPITQQYVQNDKGSYYLLDLYFPDINLFIEVDEEYHKKQVEHDNERESYIISSLSKDEVDKMDCIRIRISNKTLKEVNEQIDNAVKKINKKIPENLKWYIGKEWEDYIKKRGYIEEGDSFDDMLSIINVFDNKTRKGWQKCTFKNIWSPTLSIYKNNILSMTNSFQNTITPDGQTIFEHTSNREKYKVVKNNFKNEKENNLCRIVFIKCRDGKGLISRKFYGVYKAKELVEDENGITTIFEKEKNRVYLNEVI